MLVDAFVDLYEEGKISGIKNVLPGEDGVYFRAGNETAV